jgi:hypothetical protein
MRVMRGRPATAVRMRISTCPLRARTAPAIHRVAVTRARCHPETKAYLERKRAEGKTNREAIRCLKRHLARRIWHLLQPPPPDPDNSPNIHLLT